MSEPIAVRNCYSCPFLYDNCRCHAPCELVGFGAKKPDMYDTTIEDERGCAIYYASEDSPPNPGCPMRGRAVAYTWPTATTEATNA